MHIPFKMLLLPLHLPPPLHPHNKIQYNTNKEDNHSSIFTSEAMEITFHSRYVYLLPIFPITH